MYSNRRRSHIHFIHQYENNSKKYNGTRIVIFYKDKGKKQIKDIGDFKIHTYENPKSKNNKTSRWILKDCNLKDVIKKEMINKSVDQKYEMVHILYESEKINLENYIDDVIYEELNYIY